MKNLHGILCETENELMHRQSERGIAPPRRQIQVFDLKNYIAL